MTAETNTCPLCGRPFGSDINEHHLIPKTFKGKGTITLHRLCHNQIHHYISEREMEKYYHTVERLLEHENVQKFVNWVKNKDPDFYIMTRDTKARNRKR